VPMPLPMLLLLLLILRALLQAVRSRCQPLRVPAMSAPSQPSSARRAAAAG
jgi:hypothetical protein